MLPWERPLAGRVDRTTFTSEVLRGNVLGDPHERPLWIYLPPGYDGRTAVRYPTIYVTQGYTGRVPMWDNRTPYRRTFLEAADDVFASGKAPHCVLVFVDGWTRYGGSQLVDSPGTGRYHTYFCDEIVPWVDAHYRTLPDPRSRAVTGKSSGGFTAMVTAMLRPDLFGALATHAGDALYELCYFPEFGKAARYLRGHGHDITAWWADFDAQAASRSFAAEADGTLLMMLGLSACYSATDDGTPELPFDPRSGQPRTEQWQRWLDWDPVRMIDRHADALRSQQAIWIDAGTRDEWFLDLGAEAFRAGLKRIGVPDERVAFELFDAGHGAIGYRYPLAVAWLADRLAR
jgi:S-formylglutathione hydrolase FrmB